MEKNFRKRFFLGKKIWKLENSKANFVLGEGGMDEWINEYHSSNSLYPAPTRPVDLDPKNW